jgi:threonine dehydrogenase-like Zn-dependent dehydrogenase
MAEYAAITEKSVLRLPDDIPFEIATLIEPVAVVVHGFRMIRKMFYGSAAVIGLDPMGLLSALMLKDAGVSKLFCVEVNKQRAEAARSLGLTVIDPTEVDAVKYVLDNNDDEGVDILVEASGSAPGAKMMTAMAGVRAEILLLSVFKDAPTVDMRAVNFAEQSIIGSRVYTALDFKDAIDYVCKNQEKLAPIISHIKKLEDGQAVFQEIISGNTNTMKVLLKV